MNRGEIYRFELIIARDALRAPINLHRLERFRRRLSPHNRTGTKRRVFAIGNKMRTRRFLAHEGSRFSNLASMRKSCRSN